MLREHIFYDFVLFRLLGMFYDLRNGLHWYVFYRHWKGICILLLWGGVVHKCQLDLADGWCRWILPFPCWILSICSINCQERHIEVSEYYYGFVCFCLQSDCFCFACFVICSVHTDLVFLCFLGKSMLLVLSNVYIHSWWLFLLWILLYLRLACSFLFSFD